MAYISTVDERDRGLYVQPADYYDASNLLNSNYVLAPNDEGYGYSSDRYSTADVDVYSLGQLSAGYYVVDVDGHNWDFVNFSYGSTSSFSVLNVYGATVATSYSEYTDISFVVTTPATYYLSITGPSFGTSEYRAQYRKTGDLVDNVDATGELSISGDLISGVTVSAVGTYADANGTVSAVLQYQWLFLDSNGVWQEIDGATGVSFTISDAVVGHVLGYTVSFYDDAGYYEVLAAVGAQPVVPEANASPVALAIPTLSVTDDQLVNYDVSGSFSDDDTGDTLTYQQIGLPSGLYIDTGMGVIKGVTDDSAVTGPSATFTVTVTAADPSGATATSDFELVISAVNKAPIGLAAQDHFAYTGVAVHLQVSDSF